MRDRALRTLRVASIILVGCVVLVGAKESKYRVAELKEAPPDSLVAEVRSTLGKTGYRMTDSAGKAICDVWLRTELPVIKEFAEQLDLKYPIQPGTLIGAIRFPTDTEDYRKQQVKAGAYTIRYGHQPQDGNHLGTAQYRDFVMLVPAKDDKSADVVDQDDLVEMSTKATGSTHPAILSLLPPQKGRGKLPTTAHDDTLDLDALVAKMTTKGDGPVKEVQIELVTVGHAPE